AWSNAARESDKRALWRTLARGGWFLACRIAVQQQDRATISTWLEDTQATPHAIIQFNGPQSAQMVYTHLACGLAACDTNVPSHTLTPPGFCRDLSLALMGQPLRQAERALSMTVLLVDTARNEGVVATLTLELLPSGSGEFYPAPELAFLRDDDFRQAEDNAHAVLAPTSFTDQHHDVRWRLQRRDNKPLTSLFGPSLGAAFALGIGKLCAEEPLLPS
ncbi:MAG: hypothetical protein HOP18_00185, partial [Deltaproteobacteria bacterium]|nr:hypothetical protein [Deltaproteobacteria bacterium]